MTIGRLGLVSGLVVVGALAGCSAQELAPTREAGVPPPNVWEPPPNVSVADGGTPTVAADAGAPRALDAAMPPASVDAGADAGPVVRPARATLLTGADLSTAEVLAADGDGIYWVTGDNQLWMLPTGSDTPLQLAVDQTPTKGLSRSVSLVVGGDALFWSAWVLAPGGQYYQNPLHRTRKTGGDVVLLANCTCWSPRLAADDGHLYFPQGNVAAVNEMIVALPLDADPGTAPTPLAPLEFDAEPFAVAVDDQYVYWTTDQVDSTVQLGKDPLTRGDKAGLLAGKKSYAQFLAGTFSFLQPSGGELYFATTSGSVAWTGTAGSRRCRSRPGTRSWFSTAGC